MPNFKNKVIYQIYPKSFKDTTGNGIGDIKGIIEKIPYLKELGIDVVWLNPIFPSPQRDNGYDVSHYTEINPLFGTMEDFKTLVSELKKVEIDIMLDMVFNHTSTQHEWFQKALQGDKKYQDYYLLRPLKNNGELPTNWESKFGGPAWEKFGKTDLYYLHLFDVTQADLNWRNPDVRKEMKNILNFWLDKGVKGFRFDVMNLIGKDSLLKDAKPGQIDKEMYTDRPITHDYIRELNEATYGLVSDTVTVGEMSSTTIEQSIQYSNPTNHELDMVFSFHHLKVDYENGEKWTKIPYSFSQLKNILNDWQKGMSDNEGWNALFWNNHDQPRALNRFGHTGAYREKSGKMLAATLHLLRGTPYIYQGEEIGMINPNYTDIDDFVDVESQNAYVNLLSNGLPKQEALAMIKEKSRDNSRSPMQWDKSRNAGFTDSQTPWLKVGKSYNEINVQDSLRDEKSLFYFYKKLIKLRKEYTVISDGVYAPYLLAHTQVFAYKRENVQHELLVLNNFFEQKVQVVLPTRFIEKGKVLLSNCDHPISLKDYRQMSPFETIAILIEK